MQVAVGLQGEKGARQRGKECPQESMAWVSWGEGRAWVAGRGGGGEKQGRTGH